VVLDKFLRLKGDIKPYPFLAPTPSVPRGSRVYAVGDIHGRADLLRRLLKLIEADNEEQEEAEVSLIFLGDYIDRGPDSPDVLDILRGPHSFADRVVALRGNHEDALLNFIDDPVGARIWLDWGGMATLMSYGVRPPSSLSPEGRLKSMAEQLDRNLPEDHLAFLKSLPLQETVGDYLFVHAGVNPRVSLDEQDEYDLTTIRSPFLEWGEPLEKMVVHGHSISETPEFHSWRIGIDTGAYATGRLTALALEGREQRIISTDGVYGS
jgi:serine/threonine protein phosphatase 1